MNPDLYAALGAAIACFIGIMVGRYILPAHDDPPTEPLKPPTLFNYSVNYMENGRVMEITVTGVSQVRIARDSALLVFADVNNDSKFVVSIAQYIAHVRLEAP